MRRYKVINGSDYAVFTEGKIYDEDYAPFGFNVKHFVIKYPNDWEEVIEEKDPEPETDLEYVVRLYDNMSDEKKILFNRLIGNYE